MGTDDVSRYFIEDLSASEHGCYRVGKPSELNIPKTAEGSWTLLLRASFRIAMLLRRSCGWSSPVFILIRVHL